MAAKLLFGINKIIKAGNTSGFKGVVMRLYKILKSVLKDTWSSSIYFIFGIMSLTRIVCFTKWLFLKCLKRDKYDMVGWNNMSFMLILCAMGGTLGLSACDRAKQSDICITVLWNGLLNVQRMFAGLIEEDDERYHYVLGSKWYTSFIVALSVMMIMIVYKQKPKVLKSWERKVFQNYLLV